MNTILTIEGGGHDPEALRELLRSRGYRVRDLVEGPESCDTEPSDQEALCRELFFSAPLGMFRSTLDGRLLSVNPALARMFKYDSPEDMIATVNRTSMAERVYCKPEQRYRVISEAVRTGEWQVYEGPFLCKDGSFIECCMRLRVCPEASGELEGFAEDISARKAAEETLRQSEARYRRLMEILPIAAYTTDAEGRITFFNHCAAELWGRRPRLGKDRWCGAFRLWYPDGKPMPVEDSPVAQTLKQGKRFQGREMLQEQASGNLAHVVVYPEPLYDARGKVVGSLNLVLDITQRKQVEEQLMRANLVVENSPVVLLRWRAETGWPVVLVSKNITQFGYEPEEFLGGELGFTSIIHPDDRERVAWEVEVYATRGIDRFQQEYRILGKGGKVCWINDQTIVERDGDGQVTHFQGIIIDISSRKQTEERMKESLAEKEVLLKEIHHRVKNNLQVVSSLLYLQSRKLADEEARALFIESQSRICSMALAHEQLYQSKNLSDISLQKYVQNLAAHVRQSFMAPGAAIECRIAVDDVMLDIEKVVPCGLLITELFSNALKHAFPDNRCGTIEIRIGRQGDGMLLSVQDDGIGLPEDLDYRKAGTLGLQLVAALVEQLDGVLSVEGRGGTRVTITFPG